MEIRRSRFDSIRLKNIFKEKADSSSPSQGDVSRLSYRRSAQEEYSFENGRLVLNGKDVVGLIDAEGGDVGFMAGLATAIDEYRRTVWSRYGVEQKEFNGQTQSVLDKLLNKLTHAYEEMTGGIRVQLTGGRLWINDIDPKVVLALFLSNPTEDRRSYLASIKTKLGLILEGKVGKSHSHGILDEARKIYHQIQTAMENAPSRRLSPLLAAVGNLDR